LLAASKQRSDNTRIAPPVDHSHDPQRVFIRGVGDEVIPNWQEPERSLRQVLPGMTKLRKTNGGPNGIQNFFNDTTGGAGILRTNILPDLVELELRFWMKRETSHRSQSTLASRCDFFREVGFDSIARNQLDLAGFDFVVAAAQRFA